MTRLIIYTALLMGCSIHLYAQERLSGATNLPRPTDNIFKQQVEFKNPGKKGPDVFWDFGELDAIDAKYGIRYTQPSSCTDTLVGTEHLTNYYYVSHGDSLMLAGYENSTTQMHYSRPELLLRFPVNYGDSIHSYYNGIGNYCGKLSLMVCGSSKSVADAYGMLILPGGDTLQHVMRVHTTKLIAEKTLPLSGQDTLQVGISHKKDLSIEAIQAYLANDTTSLMEDVYKWYAAGYRYPIFETVTTGKTLDNGRTTYFSTAFYYPPSEHEYLADDGENGQIRNRLNTENTNKSQNQQGKEYDNPMLDELSFRYNFYPNPVRTTLSFEYYVSKEAKVSYELYSLSGMLAYRAEAEEVQGGAHSHKIDMDRFANGTYILRVCVNGTAYSEKIIKR